MQRAGFTEEDQIDALIKEVADEVRHKATAAKQGTSTFEHVRILHDDGDKLIITLDEDSEAEEEISTPSYEPEEEPDMEEATMK